MCETCCSGSTGFATTRKITQRESPLPCCPPVVCRGVLERLLAAATSARRLSERVERNRSRPRDLTELIAHAQELSCAWRIGLDKRCELRFERCSNTRDHGSVLGLQACSRIVSRSAVAAGSASSHAGARIGERASTYEA